MNAAQIHTRATDGYVTFQLPEEYAAFANSELLVLVVPEPNQAKMAASAQTERQARLERLRATQARLVELNPFRDIDDPVQWQRELRNEWEQPSLGRS